MVGSFAEFLNSQKSRRGGREDANKKFSMSLPLESVEEAAFEVKSITSEDHSVISEATSQYGKIKHKRSPSLSEVRIQRLESQVTNLTAEVARLAGILSALLSTPQEKE
jgi:hypothetical protein